MSKESIRKAIANADNGPKKPVTLPPMPWDQK